jgi:hypothetical protein
MTRTVLTAAVALIATTTLFTSAAEACISCEYVPEVVNTPVRGKPVQKKRVIVAAKPVDVRPVRPAKKRPVKVEAVAKAEPAPKKVDTAKAEPVETQPEAGKRPVSTAALLETGPVPAEKPEVVADLGCKKYFPTIGTTLSVPCE